MLSISFAFCLFLISQNLTLHQQRRLQVLYLIPFPSPSPPLFPAFPFPLTHFLSKSLFLSLSPSVVFHTHAHTLSLSLSCFHLFFILTFFLIQFISQQFTSKEESLLQRHAVGLGAPHDHGRLNALSICRLVGTCVRPGKSFFTLAYDLVCKFDTVTGNLAVNGVFAIIKSMTDTKKFKFF